MEEIRVNREYKDRVFRLLFSDRKNLLSLYNAVNGTDYTDEEVIEGGRLMKKIYSVALSVIVMLGSITAVYAANAAYTDIKTTNWAYEAVNAMDNKGIVKGYPDGCFKPQNTVTYGEFIKMSLIAATGQDVGNSTSGNWAQKYYEKALELGYFGSTDMKPSQLNSPIPRGDMALVISAILGETKIENYDKLEESLKDVNSSVMHDYDIVKVYASGIITGYTDGSFKPENTLSRAESATVIYRLMDESKRVMPGETKEEQPEAGEIPTKGTDIGAVIQNYKTFDQEKLDAGYGSSLAEAESYEYITDMSGYKVTLGEKLGTKWIDINGAAPLKLGWGNLYLMKDNKIIKMTNDGIYDDEYREKEHTDITTIEYFVFPKASTKLIRIMPNPLYVK